MTETHTCDRCKRQTNSLYLTNKSESLCEYCSGLFPTDEARNILIDLSTISLTRSHWLEIGKYYGFTFEVTKPKYKHDYSNPRILDTFEKVAWADEIERSRGSDFRWRLGDHCHWRLGEDGEVNDDR